DRWATSGLGQLAPRLQFAFGQLGGVPTGALWLLAAVPILLAALAVARRRRPGRLRLSRGPARASELFRLYERAQRRRARRRLPAETPLEYWRETGGEEGAFRRLTEAVNLAVYAGRPPGPEHV